MSSNAFAKNSGNKKMFGGTMMIILVIIVIFFIYTQIQSYWTFFKKSPYLIQDIHDATIAKKIPASRIQQPSDSKYGTEFTYTFWMYINDTTFKPNSQCGDTPKLQHVFHKGSYDYYQNHDSSGNLLSTPYHYPILQSPGVWLYENTNKLNIQFNTYNNVVETCDIGNIPLNMWVNITIILIGNSVDVYVNCNLKKRQKLSGVPKLNYGDLYITNWNGYMGYISKLRYFNYAVQPYMLDEICKMGPATTMEPTNNNGQTVAQLSPNYWMSTGYPNGYGFPGYLEAP